MDATSGRTVRLDRKGISSYDELDEDLDIFSQASPMVKRQLRVACATAAARDGKLSSGEAELLRTIADSIGCPLPPFPGEVVEEEI